MQPLALTDTEVLLYALLLYNTAHTLALPSYPDALQYDTSQHYTSNHRRSFWFQNPFNISNIYGYITYRLETAVAVALSLILT